MSPWSLRATLTAALGLAAGLPSAAACPPPVPPLAPPLPVSPAPQDADAEPGAAPPVVRTLQIGESLGGRPLRAVVVGAGSVPLEERQGVLLVATLDGRRAGDHRIVAEVLEQLLDTEDLTGRLDGKALVLVAVANPDGLLLENLGRADAPPPAAGNRRPRDADRDGRTDEDGPSDLDGDGVIAWMRVPDGAGEWVIDEHDPRALRKARTERGERGTHRLVREGLDDDGDGAWHEDDGGGVRPDRNFPQGWPEYHPDAGAYPLSEPESKALHDFLRAHPGFSAVVVLGAEDTLVSTPKAAKKVERSRWGRGLRAVPDGPLEGDVEVMKELKRRFEALEGEKHDAKGEGLQDGGLLSWAYFQAGRWPLGVTPWATPEKLPEKKKESDGEGGEGEGDDAGSDDAGKPEGGKNGKKGDAGGDKPTSDKDSPVSAAVLAWLDEHRDGQGIVPWTAFDHPELGEVEIGGLSESTLLGAGREDEKVDALAARLAGFLLETCEMMPALAFEDLEVEDHGDGVYGVEVTLVNTGVLPTCPELAGEADLVRPVRVRAALPEGVERLHGPEQVLVRHLEGGGGRRTLRWLVGGATTGTRLVLSADADVVRDIELEVILP